MNPYPRGLAHAVGWCALLVSSAACGPTDAGGSKSAKSYLDAGDLRSAEISIGSHLKAYPESGPGHWLMGRLRLRQGDPAAAEVDFRRALRYGVAADQIFPELADALLAQEKYNALIDELANKKMGDPAADAALQTAVANAYARQNMVEPAELAVAAALTSLANYQPARVLQARLMAGRGQLPEAMTLINELLAKGGPTEPAWTLKGDLLVQAKAPQVEIVDAYAKAAKLGPNAVHPQTMLMSIFMRKRDFAAATTQLTSMLSGLPRHPNTGYFDAYLAFELGDYQRARFVMLKLLAGAPDNETFLLLAGRIELALGSTQAAQSVFEKVVLASPGSAQGRRLYAQTLLANGFPEKAIDTLRPALRGGDLQVESFALAARTYQALGNQRAEEEAFATAARIDPQHPLVRTAQALTLLGKGEHDAGLTQLQQVADSDTGTDADLTLIRNSIRLNRLEVAQKAIDRLEAKLPGASMPNVFRGEAALAANDTAGARGFFEAAFKTHADLMVAVDNLARLDEKDNKPEAAAARYRALIQRSPKNAAAWLALAGLRTRMQVPAAEVLGLMLAAVKADPTYVPAHQALIEWHLRAGLTQEALLAAQRASTALPNDAALLKLLGDAELAMQDYSQAIVSFRRLVGLRPRSAEAYARLADAQSGKGDMAGAGDSLTQALRLAPEWPPLQEAAFSLAMRDGRTKDALRIARALQAKLPDQALGYRLEGDAEAVQRHWKPAIEHFRAALTRQNPGNTAVRLHVALLASGDVDAAAKFAASWRAQNKTDARFVNHLAETALLARDLPSAEQLFAQVLAIDPKNASALNNLAYLSLGRQDGKALAFAERAVAAQPNNPLILDTLASAFADVGQMDRAIETQRRALDLAPGNGGLRMAMAKLYLRVNSKERARQELNVLAQLGPRFSAQNEVSALMREANR